jgi:hypothetical protein
LRLLSANTLDNVADCFFVFVALRHACNMWPDFVKAKGVKSDDLAKHVKDRLGTQVQCTVFEDRLSVVWPRAYEVDSRMKEIESFAKANGWSVRISDLGIRITFKKLTK